MSLPVKRGSDSFRLFGWGLVKFPGKSDSWSPVLVLWNWLDVVWSCTNLRLILMESESWKVLVPFSQRSPGTHLQSAMFLGVVGRCLPRCLPPGGQALYNPPSNLQSKWDLEYAGMPLPWLGYRWVKRQIVLGVGPNQVRPALQQRWNIRESIIRHQLLLWTAYGGSPCA